jgi:hypothetical protein
MKRLSVIILFALPFIFTSCEGDFEDFFGDLLDQASGSAEVFALEENSNDTVFNGSFEFSAVSVIDTTIENVDISYLIGISAHTSMEEQQIDFPYMLCTLGDTLEGLHIVNFTIDTSFILNFDYEEFVQTNRENIAAIIADEEKWYIGSSGSIQLDVYEGYGGLVDGSFNNVIAYHLTQEIVDDVVDNYEAGNIVQTLGIIANIPTVTLHGNFSSRNIDVMQFLQ